MCSTGEVDQWLGVALYDDSGIASGLVQIGVRTSNLATLMKSLQIDHVLDGRGGPMAGRRALRR